LGTLSNIRNNSKAYIWALVIMLIIGFVIAPSIMGQTDRIMNFFGFNQKQSYSMMINGQEIPHQDRTINRDDLSYISTFYGSESSSNGLRGSQDFEIVDGNVVFTSSIKDYDVYKRHLETEAELAGRVISSQLHNDLFEGDLSDLDILTFMLIESKTNPGSRLVSWYLSATTYTGFNEDFVDIPDGRWSSSEDFIDANDNKQWDPGEIFTDSEGNGVWDQGDKIKDCGFYTNDQGEEDLICVGDDGWKPEYGNGILDDGEEFIDCNGRSGRYRVCEDDTTWNGDSMGNGTYDKPETFTDKPNGRYDNGEEFTDTGNGKWDEGESFTDCNETGSICDGDKDWDASVMGNKKWDDGEKFTDAGNGKWDEGESFTDTGDGVWDNGLIGWITHCMSNGKIDYDLIANQNIAANLKDFINTVSSYDAKKDKYSIVYNSMNHTSDIDRLEDFKSKNLSGTVSYISYDLNNLDEVEVESKINSDLIKSEIPNFKEISTGYFSNGFLIAMLAIFAIFSALNRKNRIKLALGGTASIILSLIVIFKLISDSEQNSTQYKEISYMFISANDIIKSEEWDDKGDGIWNPNEGENLILDCGQDGLCEGDEGYEGPDDGEGNGKLDKEPLILDNNRNGLWDEGDDFTDSNKDGIWNSAEKFEDKKNNKWNEGEDFKDCGIDLLCEGDEGYEGPDIGEGNGKWDSKEDLLALRIAEITAKLDSNPSNFKSIYDESDFKKDEKIILSKQFNQENLDNLSIGSNRFLQSTLLDLIKETFATDKDNYFEIKVEGSSPGSIIAYVTDEGNYFEKSEYEKLKKKHLKKAKEEVLLSKSTLDPIKFAEDVNSVLSGNKTQDDMKSDYSELNLNLETETIPSDPLVRGYISKMAASEVSDVLFSGNTAYIVYLHELNPVDSLALESSNYNNRYNNFENLFSSMISNAEILDWRGEASYLIPSVDANQNQNRIDDIYFNVSNFEAVINSLYRNNLDIK